MRKWLRGRTAFQSVALALTVFAAGAVIISYLSFGDSHSGWIVLALIVCSIAFRKELLWRVRNRLLVTFFLFGILPIFLIGFMLTLSAELLFAQFASERVRQELERHIKSVHSAAQTLSVAASYGARADLLDEIRQQTPRLAAVVRASGTILRLPPDGKFQTPPAWIPSGFGDLFEADGRYYIGADVRRGSTEAFTYFPLDEQTLALLTPRVISVAAVLHGNDRTDVSWGPSGSRMAVVENGTRREIVPSGLGLPRSWWDVPIAGMLAWTVQASSNKEQVLFPLISRPSLLVGGSLSGPMESIALSLLIAVGGLLLLVEVVSLLSSLRLTRAITRSVDDLYRGTLQVAQADFSHQIPVRGKQQLSELAASFNGMTSRIQQLIGEVKKKEKLEAELEIAREVQLRLFPKSVPKLKTLEMAGICIPGRVVSGDYYDYVRLGDRWTAIALGDVSGKGASAALLMASIQSALHAQLRFGGDVSGPVLSTAALTALISQQLYENTPAEKYATFFCSVYDDDTGRLTYTNAGHLKPILVRDGEATPLEGDGMVIGLLPNVKYEEHDVVLRTGDLLAIFSDGIPEAFDAADQEFGEGRLAELLITQRDNALQDIVTAVTHTIEKWIYEPEARDDLTLVLLRKL